MNPIYQSLKSVRISTALFVSLFLFNSCSQDDDMFGTKEPAYTYSGEPIPVSPGHASIEHFGSGAVTRSGDTKVKSAYREPLDDDYDIITEVESVPEENQPLTRANLANSIRFRIVAYKNNAVSTANYVAQTDYYINGNGGSPALVSGSKAMALQSGTYKFVCYSYNTSTALAAFNGSSTTTIPVTHGQDFLVCVLNNQSVTPNASGQFTLPAISFNRLCSQVQIIAKTEKAGNITACSATVSGLSPNQNYTMGSTELTTAGSGGTANVSWPSVNSATANSNTQRILPNNSRTVTINMTFTAGGTNYSNKSFTIANRTFAKGTNYKITYNIVKNSVTVTGLSFKVALGNVIKVGNTYKFQASQGDYSGVWNGGDYYNWGVINPLDYTKKNTYWSGNDVCKEIGDKWRSPNDREIKEFLSASQVWGEYTNSSNIKVNGRYYGTSSVPDPSNKDNVVFLPAAGNRRAGEQSMFDVNNRGYYTCDLNEGTGVRTLTVIPSKTYFSLSSKDGGATVRCIGNK